MKESEDVSKLLSKALAKCNEMDSFECIDQLKSLADMLQTKINSVQEKSKKPMSVISIAK